VVVGNDANNNFPVLRYADAILLLVKPIGESPEAYALINQGTGKAQLGPIRLTPGTFTENNA